MTAVLLVAVFTLGLAIGARVSRRRHFNRGVTAGRAAELLEHGWRPDFALAVPRPRRWRRLDRKADDPQPAPSYAPWVDTRH